MTILIIGGAGFIGTNFVFNYLNQRNDNLIVYDKLTYAGKKENFKTLRNNNRFKFIKGDITNKDKLKKVVFEHNPSVIINFAAETHVDNSIDHPKSFIITNIFGTFTLLNVIKKYYESLRSKEKNKFAFLNISTDEVFGSLKLLSRPFKENSPFMPNSPYSASKASADHLVRSYYKTYEIPSITTHCSNNFGPYQHEEKFIPKIIKNALKWSKIPIYGEGKNVRDWIFVDDHCKALIKIIENGHVGETYNIGAGKEVSNINLAKLICRKLDVICPNQNDSYETLISFVKDRAGHDFRYSIDSTKLKSSLDWKLTKTFDQSLHYTIEWYVKNFLGLEKL